MAKEEEGPLETPFTVILELHDSRGVVMRHELKLDAVFLSGVLTDGKAGETMSFIAGEPHDIMAAAMPALTQVAALQFKMAHLKKRSSADLPESVDGFIQSLAGRIAPPPTGD